MSRWLERALTESVPVVPFVPIVPIVPNDAPPPIGTFGINGTVGTNGTSGTDADHDRDRPPRGVAPKAWRLLLADLETFRRDWSDRAAELGWSELELYGADRRAPWERVDRSGLVWMLRGRPVVAMTADTATIATPSGGHLTYRCRRREFAECITLAELATTVTRTNGTSPTKSGPHHVG